MDKNPISQISDKEIVTMTLRERSSFGFLVERYEAKLKRYINRLGVRNNDDQLDVLQDIFIKAYKNLNSFDTQMSFSAWIYRIAHNEAISWYRKHNVRPEGHMVADSSEILELIKSKEETPDIVFDKNINAEMLNKALLKIDEKYREILTLRFFEHLEYDEISDVLKIPIGSVGTLIYRGKKQLYNELNKDFYTYMNNMEKDKPEIELKTSVLQRIENENVCPTPRSLFVCYDYLAWGLWLLATLIGALAIAVTLFVFSYQQYAFYELTHDNFLTFVEDVLPVAWVLILVGMIVFSVYNIRHTKRGYRYPLWQVLGSSLILSFVGGVFLHMIGVGFNFDKWLGKNITSYESQEKMEQRFWQHPESGLLVGYLVKGEKIADTAVWFEDVNGVIWQVDVSDLQDNERSELETNKSVRMIGKVLTLEPPYFHACSAFPWLYEFDHSQNELREHRDMIMHRFSHFYKDEFLNETNIDGNSFCADILPIQRLKVRFDE
jgi:RNA polymerase sigma-70 factor (ECF subfamily)